MPGRTFGIGAAGRGSAQAAPTAPSNGSGGSGALSFSRPDFSAARSEIGDVTTGRVTLGVVNLALVGLIAFYIWTRSAQGG